MSDFFFTEAPKVQVEYIMMPVSGKAGQWQSTVRLNIKCTVPVAVIVLRAAIGIVVVFQPRVFLDIFWQGSCDSRVSRLVALIES